MIQRLQTQEAKLAFAILLTGALGKIGLVEEHTDSLVDQTGLEFLREKFMGVLGFPPTEPTESLTTDGSPQCTYNFRDVANLRILPSLDKPPFLSIVTFRVQLAALTSLMRITNPKTLKSGTLGSQEHDECLLTWLGWLTPAQKRAVSAFLPLDVD